MSKCDTCAFCHFNIHRGCWLCDKGHDPVCQSRKLLSCPDYENRGRYAAKKALKLTESDNREKTMSLKFEKLREIIKEDRQITDITTRHNWLIDKWREYTETRNQLAIEHDTLRHKLLFNTNWEELNEKRTKEGLPIIGTFKERKDYIGQDMIDIDMKLNEIDKILDYLGTRG